MINEASYILIPLVIGIILDSLLGDPHWLPHPIRIFGKSIAWAEQRYNKGKNRKQKGLWCALVLIITTWLFFFILIELLIPQSWLYFPVAGILVFYGIAQRSLIAEALLVNRKLEEEGLEAGRRQLSMIVGRDTSSLNEKEVRIAVLETLAENLSDGVIAPLFYYAIGGIPLMFTYKMINTLDSMIGYKSERFKSFGWFAAKIDDIVNYIPARITALFMALLSFHPRGFRFMIKYGNQHSSPNAGYPEAALAGILNCRFGGPAWYHGEKTDKPYIGENNREPAHKDIIKTLRLNVAVTVLSLIIIVLAYI